MLFYLTILSMVGRIEAGVHRLAPSRREERAQTSNLTNLVIGIMISGIVIMRVFIPVISDAASNLTGTEATIANLLPLFAVLLLLIALASPLTGR